MRAISNAIAIASSLLLVAVALAGCGSGEASSASTSAAAAVAKLRTITVTSPAVVGATAATLGRFTCAGRDASLPVQWSHVPPGAGELLLVVLALSPVTEPGGAVRTRVTPQWAVAGLAPTAGGLTLGTLPRGAIVGRNAQGRSSPPACPARGTHEAYGVMVFASRRRLSLRPGFSDQSLWIEMSELKPPFGELLTSLSRA